MWNAANRNTTRKIQLNKNYVAIAVNEVCSTYNMQKWLGVLSLKCAKHKSKVIQFSIGHNFTITKIAMQLSISEKNVCFFFLLSNVLCGASLLRWVKMLPKYRQFYSNVTQLKSPVSCSENSWLLSVIGTEAHSNIVTKYQTIFVILIESHISPLEKLVH